MIQPASKILKEKQPIEEYQNELLKACEILVLCAMKPMLTEN